MTISYACTRIAILISLWLSAGQAVAAALPPAGSLIKGSSASVYYLATSGKRYVFPTEATFYTWYADFSGVITVSDQDLATIPLGKNVTYRPGSRLIKIMTDPRVYVVDTGGVLRWIETAAVAQALYGDTWSRSVDDLSEAFFTNYTMGTPIHAAEAFQPTTTKSLAISIEADQVSTLTPTLIVAPNPIITTPSTTTTSSSVLTLLLETSLASPRPGEAFTLTARALPSSIDNMQIFFNGSLVRSCESSPCATEVVMPITNTKPAYELLATARTITREMVTTTKTLEAGTGSPYIAFRLSRQEVEPNAQREVVAFAQNGFLARYLDIYIDGGLVRSCVSQQECRYTATEQSVLGTIHSVHVIAIDGAGMTTRSDTKSFTVVLNDRPMVTVEPGKTELLRGETVDVLITARDDDSISKTEIWLDNLLIKSCQTSNCSTVVGPFSQARTLIIEGRSLDSVGALGTASSTTITVR